MSRRSVIDGKRVCVSGIEPVELEKITSILLSLGASLTMSLTKDVALLVAAKGLSQKCCAAYADRIPVVTPAAFDDSQRFLLSATNISSVVETFEAKPLFGYLLCTTGFSSTDPVKREMLHRIQQLGGAITPRLEANCECLLVPWEAPGQGKERESNKLQFAWQRCIPVLHWRVLVELAAQRELPLSTIVQRHRIQAPTTAIAAEGAEPPPQAFQPEGVGKDTTLPPPLVIPTMLPLLPPKSLRKEVARDFEFFPTSSDDAPGPVMFSAPVYFVFMWCSPQELTLGRRWALDVAPFGFHQQPTITSLTTHLVLGRSFRELPSAAIGPTPELSDDDRQSLRMYFQSRLAFPIARVKSLSWLEALATGFVKYSTASDLSELLDGDDDDDDAVSTMEGGGMPSESWAGRLLKHFEGHCFFPHRSHIETMQRKRGRPAEGHEEVPFAAIANANNNLSSGQRQQPLPALPQQPLPALPPSQGTEERTVRVVHTPKALSNDAIALSLEGLVSLFSANGGPHVVAKGHDWAQLDSKEKVMQLLDCCTCHLVFTESGSTKRKQIFDGIQFLCEQWDEEAELQAAAHNPCQQISRQLPRKFFSLAMLAAIRLLVKALGGTLVRKSPSEWSSLVDSKAEILKPQKRKIATREGPDEVSAATLILVPHCFEVDEQLAQQQLLVSTSDGGAAAQHSSSHRKSLRQGSVAGKQKRKVTDGLQSATGLPRVTTTWLLQAIAAGRATSTRTVTNDNFPSFESLGCRKDMDLLLTFWQHQQCASRPAHNNKLVSSLPSSPSPFLTSKRYIKHQKFEEEISSYQNSTDRRVGHSVGHGVHVALLLRDGGGPQRRIMRAYLERFVEFLGGCVVRVDCTGSTVEDVAAVLDIRKTTHVVTDATIPLSEELTKSLAMLGSNNDILEASSALDESVQILFNGFGIDSAATVNIPLLECACLLASGRDDICVCDISWLRRCAAVGYFVDESSGYLVHATSKWSEALPSIASSLATDAIPLNARGGELSVPATVGCDGSAEASRKAPHVELLANFSTTATTTTRSDVTRGVALPERNPSEAIDIIDISAALEPLVTRIVEEVGEGNSIAHERRSMLRLKRPRTPPPVPTSPPEIVEQPVPAVISEMASTSRVTLIEKPQPEARITAPVCCERPTSPHVVGARAFCSQSSSSLIVAQQCHRSSKADSNALHQPPSLPLVPPACDVSRLPCRVYLLSTVPGIDNLRSVVKRFAAPIAFIDKPSTTVAWQGLESNNGTCGWNCMELVETASEADVIVADEVMQRESVLFAIAAGRWLVTPDFIAACAREHHVATAEPYEWTAAMLPEAFQKKKPSVLLAASARFWRMLRTTLRIGPFGNPCLYSIVLGDMPSQAVIGNVLTAGGGQVSCVPAATSDGEAPRSVSVLISLIVQRLEVSFADWNKDLEREGAFPCKQSTYPLSRVLCRRNKTTIVVMISPELWADPKGKKELTERLKECCDAQRTWTARRRLAINRNFEGVTSVIAHRCCNYYAHLVSHGGGELDASIPSVCTPSHEISTSGNEFLLWPELDVAVFPPEWSSWVLQRRDDKLCNPLLMFEGL